MAPESSHFLGRVSRIRHKKKKTARWWIRSLEPVIMPAVMSSAGGRHFKMNGQMRNENDSSCAKKSSGGVARYAYNI